MTKTEEVKGYIKKIDARLVDLEQQHLEGVCTAQEIGNLRAHKLGVVYALKILGEEDEN